MGYYNHNNYIRGSSKSNIHTLTNQKPMTLIRVMKYNSLNVTLFVTRNVVDIKQNGTALCLTKPLHNLCFHCGFSFHYFHRVI